MERNIADSDVLMLRASALLQSSRDASRVSARTVYEKIMFFETAIRTMSSSTVSSMTEGLAQMRPFEDVSRMRDRTDSTDRELLVRNPSESFVAMYSSFCSIHSGTFVAMVSPPSGLQEKAAPGRAGSCCRFVVYTCVCI